MSFDYLMEKIEKANPVEVPFRHLYIENFFSPEDFTQITGAAEIGVHAVGSDAELFDKLFGFGYKVIDFPGCVTDRDAYIRWHSDPPSAAGHNGLNNSACEGFGVVLRLLEPRTAAVKSLHDFINGQAFIATLARKFGLAANELAYDAGIQKYLDGYEISPHPDIRSKALTYMVNINPGQHSEGHDHHTHYMRFDARYRYVQSYWEGHPEADRCWVPWDWCHTEKVQRANNSIVAFAPGDSTLHAVKARYNHLQNQRTQLYGNLWFPKAHATTKPEWEDFVIRQASGSVIASGVQGAPDDPHVIQNRLACAK